MPIDYTQLQDALKKLRQKDGATNPEKGVRDMIDRAKPKLVHGNMNLFYWGITAGTLLLAGGVSLTRFYVGVAYGDEHIYDLVWGTGCLLLSIAVIGLAKTKINDLVVEEDIKAIVKEIIKEHPEIAGEIGAEKLMRLVTVVQIIETHVEPEQRKDLEALKAKYISGPRDDKTLEDIGQILANHLADNPGDLKMIKDALQNKAMPWELASQYSQKQQGAHS